MINFDEVTKENIKEHNPHCSKNRFKIQSHKSATCY